MARLYEMIPRATQLELALQAQSPARVARIFAAYVGQFYDRSTFDTMARQASDLYGTESAERARSFRVLLDRRLSDRYHAPVVWESTLAKEDHQA